MNTENPYIEPTAKQTKGLCGKVAENLTLPTKELAQYWIDHPGALATRLQQALCFRPARVPGASESMTDSEVIFLLEREGLVASQKRGTSKEDLDLVIIGCHTHEARVEARRLAEKGLIVIAKVSFSDDREFASHENIFLFAGNLDSVTAISITTREALYRLQDRFWAGPKQ